MVWTNIFFFSYCFFRFSLYMVVAHPCSEVRNEFPWILQTWNGTLRNKVKYYNFLTCTCVRICELLFKLEMAEDGEEKRKSRGRQRGSSLSFSEATLLVSPMFSESRAENPIMSHACGACANFMLSLTETISLLPRWRRQMYYSCFLLSSGTHKVNGFLNLLRKPCTLRAFRSTPLARGPSVR